MGWPFKKHEDPEHGLTLHVAEQKVDELEDRANRVVPELIARRQRNHWGEAIASIARKGHHA